MVPLYNKALIIGATSGIGEALAAKLVANGTKVIVVGRRQDRLDTFVKKHGAEHASAVAFDITNLSGIKAFAESVIKANPELDSVIINSGIQRPFFFTEPETVNLTDFVMENTTNYLAPVHLTAAFLPHLKTQTQSQLVYVSSTLGLVPALIRAPGYNATKAALHSFAMAVRQQLKDAGQTNIRMVEVMPPAVQTELHDTKHQPDMVNGGDLGMPLAEFTDKMYEGLVRGDETFAVGPGEAMFTEEGWETQREKMFAKQHAAVVENLGKFLKK